MAASELTTLGFVYTLPKFSGWYNIYNNKMFFSRLQNHFMAMGNTNTQPVNTAMRDFIKINYLITLVRGNSCFKGQNSCINTILLIKRRF